MILPLSEGENQLLAAALGYARHGWRVFPAHTVIDGKCSCGRKTCDRIGKHPRTAHGLHDATTDEDQIRRWWEQWPQANVAIATGPASGVFMVGPDGQQGIADLAALEDQFGALPITPKERSGGGGLHHYFLWPAEGAVKNRRNHHGLKIDVRGSGGYAIVAPSINKDGAYVWEIPPDHGAIAQAPSWLLDWVRNDGKPKKNASATPTMAEVKNPNSAAPLFTTNGHMIFIVKPDATPDVQARAVAYLASCAPAVSGDGGHNQTLTVARAIVYGFNLGTDSGFNLLWQHYNPTCRPPWTEAELRHKCEQADTVPFDKPRGYLLTAESGTASPTNLSGGSASAGAPGTDGQQAHAGVDTEPDIESMPISPPPAWPTLQAVALHGMAGQIIRAVEPETEAETAAILVQLLTLFGSAVGRGPHFRVGPARHYGNLFTLIVGDTSSAKGMSLDIAQDVIHRADPAWADVCVHRGLGSGEGVVEAVRDPITATVAVKDKGGQVTGFNTVIVEEGCQDKRLLAVETEFASIIKRNKRENSILSETLRCSWDGGRLEVLNRKENALRATNAHISIVGHITPDELRHVLKGTPELVNGFANRFLWVLTRSSKSLPHGGDASVLDPFIEPMAQTIGKARTIGEVQRSEAANKLWEDVYEDLKRSRSGDYGKARERARPQTMRLALVYALLDGAAVIEADHLQAALAVWHYCDESLQLIFGTEPPDPLADLVLAKIRESADGLTRTELRDAFNRNLRNGQLLEALAKLRDKGLIEAVSERTDGRPAERWRLRRNDRTPEGQQYEPPPSVVPSFGRSVVEADGERVVRL